MQDKKKLSERDICTQYITPALQQAGWDFAPQVREEVSFTRGRVIVRGNPPCRLPENRSKMGVDRSRADPVTPAEAGVQLVDFSGFRPAPE